MLTMPSYPIPLDSGLEERHHEAMVQRKLRQFSWDNPLGISSVLHYIVIIICPIFVHVGIGMNVFGSWTLQSTFIRDLPMQPLLSTLVSLNCLAIVVGPLYIWMVQFTSFYILQEQIFHCFFLTSLHNFAMIATAFIVVAIVYERTFVIGKPKSQWPARRRWLSKLTSILLFIAALLSLAVIHSMDLESMMTTGQYPICVPWWENEHVSPLWYKIFACTFSLGPVVFITIGILLLELRVARFNNVRRIGRDALPNYQAMLFELTSAVHLKFVNSASCIGLAFLLLCCPAGLYIIAGPALHVKASRILTITRIQTTPFPINSSLTLDPPLTHLKLDNLITSTPREGPFLDGNTNQTNNETIRKETRKKRTVVRETRDVRKGGSIAKENNSFTNSVGHDWKGNALHIQQQHKQAKNDQQKTQKDGDKSATDRESSRKILNPFLYRYILISRVNSETIVWLMRYSFSVLVVPLLLATEVIFRREWRGRMRQMRHIICCRCGRKSSSRLSPKFGNSITDAWKATPLGNQADGTGRMVAPSVSGPYIARLDEDNERNARKYLPTKKGLIAHNKIQSFKVFDASKPARAGRCVSRIGTIVKPKTELVKQTKLGANVKAKPEPVKRTKCKILVEKKYRKNQRATASSERPRTLVSAFKTIFGMRTETKPAIVRHIKSEGKAKVKNPAKSKKKMHVDETPKVHARLSRFDSDSTTSSWSAPANPPTNLAKIATIENAQRRLANEAVAVVTATAMKRLAASTSPRSKSPKLVPVHIRPEPEHAVGIRSPLRVLRPIHGLHDRSPFLWKNEESFIVHQEIPSKTLSSTPKAIPIPIPKPQSPSRITKGVQTSELSRQNSDYDQPRQRSVGISASMYDTTVDYQLLAQLAALDVQRRDFINRNGQKVGPDGSDFSGTSLVPGISASDTTMMPITNRGAGTSGRSRMI